MDRYHSHYREPSDKMARGIFRARKISDKWDFWTSKACYEIAEAQKLIEEVKARQNVLLPYSKTTAPHSLSSDRARCRLLHDWNPRHLSPVQDVLIPHSLLSVYVRERPFVRVEDEALHNVRRDADLDKGIYRVRRPGPALPFKTRDDDGLRILGGLEIYRNGGRGEEWEREGQDEKERRETLLFTRNWPMTEFNSSRSLQEFIKR